MVLFVAEPAGFILVILEIVVIAVSILTILTVFYLLFSFFGVIVIVVPVVVISVFRKNHLHCLFCPKSRKKEVKANSILWHYPSAF